MIAVTIRTANRAPHPNHLRNTVGQLLTQGVSTSDIYVSVTDPDARWLESELAGMPVHLDVPIIRRTPNENGLAMIASIPEPERYEWVLLLEDDLQFCRDFLGSVERWLAKFAQPHRHLYRFFGFTDPPRKAAAYDVRLERLRASQAQAMRTPEAMQFLAWGRQHLHDWPLLTAWGRKHQQDAYRGFDKFTATFCLITWPGRPGLASHPHFVKHIGLTSSIHQRTASADARFAGVNWSFR